MCSWRLCNGRVGNGNELVVVGLLVDPIGTIVTIGARVLLTGFPVVGVVLRIPPSMDVFLISDVPGVLSAGAVQGEGCRCWTMGTLLFRGSAPRGDLDLMSRRLDDEPLDADRQRSIGRGDREPEGDPTRERERERERSSRRTQRRSARGHKIVDS